MEQQQSIQRLVGEKNFQQAYQLLLQLVSEAPHDYVFLCQLGYVLYQMRAFDEALDYYKRCINIYESEIDSLFISNWFAYHQYGKLLHLHRAEYVSAKHYYIKSLKLNEHNTPIYHDIAKLHVDTHDYAEAQTYFEQYLELIRITHIYNNTHEAHCQYGRLLFYQIELKTRGRSHMQLAIDLSPDNDVYHYEMALMMKLSNSFEQSRQSFAKCVQLTAERNATYLFQYGLLLTESLQNPSYGMLFVKKALDLEPHNEQYQREHLALQNWNASAANAKPNANAAAAAMLIPVPVPVPVQVAVPVDSHMYAANMVSPRRRGQYKLSSGGSTGNSNQQREIYNTIKRDARRIKFEDGSQDTSQSVDWDKICGTSDKYSSRILEFKSKFKIACQAQAEHNYVLAKNILEDLIKIAPEDGEIFGRYAFALAQLNILQKAEKYYKKSLILSPRNYVTMYNYAFLLYYKLKRYHKAECLYKKCLKIKPNCAKALLNYARLLDTIKEKKRSEQYYRMCLSGSPNYDLCFYYFGCFLYRQERYEEAKYFLQKAVDCWPHSHLHHFRLAVTCHILCEYGKCEHHLKQALRIKPQFEAAMEAFERYGYGQIHRDAKNGKLVFSHFRKNRMMPVAKASFRNNHYNNHASKYTNNNYNNNYTYNNNSNNSHKTYPYKHTNRFGRYYVRKVDNGGASAAQGVRHMAAVVSNNSNNNTGSSGGAVDDGESTLGGGADGSDDTSNSSNTSHTATTETDVDEERSTSAAAAAVAMVPTTGGVSHPHLRMYDPVRRNHRFNIDENWVDDSRHACHNSDDKKYFINWLKSIRLYEQVKPVFAQRSINTMKQFHSQFPRKQSLMDMFVGHDHMVNVIWQSAPKRLFPRRAADTSANRE